jgi:hypothetical protein
VSGRALSPEQRREELIALRIELAAVRLECERVAREIDRRIARMRASGLVLPAPEHVNPG